MTIPTEMNALLLLGDGYARSGDSALSESSA